MPGTKTGASSPTAQFTSMLSVPRVAAGTAEVPAPAVVVPADGSEGRSPGARIGRMFTTDALGRGCGSRT